MHASQLVRMVRVVELSSADVENKSVCMNALVSVPGMLVILLNV